MSRYGSGFLISRPKSIIRKTSIIKRCQVGLGNKAEKEFAEFTGFRVRFTWLTIIMRLMSSIRPITSLQKTTPRPDQLALNN